MDSGYTYYEMVIEALSAINDENGVDIDVIFNFIKERHEVTPNFRKKLRDKLRKLVSKNKLEKVENRYKIIDGNTCTSKEATKNPEDSRKPQELPEVDAAVAVVAVAEYFEFQAKEAFDVADTTIQLLKESYLVLKLATEILDLCNLSTTSSSSSSSPSIHHHHYAFASFLAGAKGKKVFLR